MDNKKKVSIIVAVFITAVLLGWLYIESSKPLPGKLLKDEGREHVDTETVVNYGTNPPTSGNHYADSVESGVYTQQKDDRNLVHSLEHGYVIMSYNCDHTKLSLVPEAFAHESAQSAQSSPSASLSEKFESADCKKLVEQLTAIYEKKGKKKLIVIPRPNLETRIALTAWNYLDKFDDFDSRRIEKFIDAHFNKGPELTIE